jgi:2,5-diamino-6-(ribosylamino)-4(3H)-pyrimidinone 5'-phosphate reductase
MLPKVILHNSVSADGRNTEFIPDIGLHYELTSRWKFDVHLVGSNTILKSEEEVPPEGDEDHESPEAKPDDKRSLLVVPDSRGRIRSWHALRKAGMWRGLMALCSRSTPKEYLEYLEQRDIGSIVAGDDRVDIGAALEKLNADYGVKTVLLDSGGTLNGVLLRAGLVDEVSLLVHPCLAGGSSPLSFFRDMEAASLEGVIQLRLKEMEKRRGDTVWLHYEVAKEA